MNQIDKAVSDFSMLQNGKKIIVGLSGGADSITLIHYLKSSLSCEVIACHINHNLRGLESARDRDFVAEFCAKHGIELFIKEADILSFAKEHKMTVEEAGRAVRYGFFEEIRALKNASYIATAHTLSDNAETVLLNLTRGTALSGLCGIPAVRGNIIRPLIYSTRDEIEDYCEKNSLEYVTDSTNKQDIYSRNNIRNNVIPVLKQINPAFEAAIMRTVFTLRGENDYLDFLAQQLFYECKNGCLYETQKLNEANEALRNRVIGRILDENKIEKSSDLICTISGIIARSEGKLSIAKNIYAEVKNLMLSFYEEKEPLEYFEDELILGEYVAKSGECYRISKYSEKSYDYTKKVYRNLLYILLDYDKIIGKAFIRQRKVADEISFVGRKGTRSLKKLFIDKKFTQYEKSKTLVLADEGGIIGVYGFGVSSRVEIDEHTQTILKIEKL